MKERGRSEPQKIGQDSIAEKPLTEAIGRREALFSLAAFTAGLGFTGWGAYRSEIRKRKDESSVGGEVTEDVVDGAKLVYRVGKVITLGSQGKPNK